MAYDPDSLRLLQQETARKKQLEAQREELYTQRQQLQVQVTELEKRRQAEQADVDRLEGRSLAAFFYHVMGTKEEKLNKERREAYAARVKYDAAALALSNAEEDIRRIEDELDQLQDAPQRYEEALNTKAQAMKADGSPHAAKLLQAEEKIVWLEHQEKELSEAISAGQTALDLAGRILNSLDSAKDWGTFDLLGGGLLSDLAKYDHLDRAQALVEELQEALRRFKTELADVAVHSEMQVGIGEFLRFADYFFDGLFADWAVLDRIGQAQSQAQDTERQIQQVLDQLQTMLLTTQSDLTQAQEDRRHILLTFP